LIKTNYDEVIDTAFASFVAFAEKKPEVRLVHLDLETLIEIILIKASTKLLCK
jgi:hypothetical protein